MELRLYTVNTDKTATLNSFYHAFFFQKVFFFFLLSEKVIPQKPEDVLKGKVCRTKAIVNLDSFFSFLFFVFCLFRASPLAYGRSRARDPIRVTAAQHIPWA